MEWIKANIKPESDMQALVINTKGWMGFGDQIAHYHKKYDCWVAYSRDRRESFTLEITHYFPILEPPRGCARS